MRNAFIKELTELAGADPRIMFITGDLGFGVIEDFQKKFPNQFVNVGVAEQNMTGLASGLALCGRIVFTYSIGNFPTLRCFEQIRNDVCYHNLNVKIVTIGGGFAYGALGSSHHATEDLAVMRALPGMTVIAPGDPVETMLATRAVVSMPGPCYLRLSRSNDPVVHASPPAFEIGKALVIREGHDVTLISTGGMLPITMNVAELLSDRGVQARILSMHTVKPIDQEAIIRAGKETPFVVTIEEHQIGAGLGGAVAEVLMESNLEKKPRFKRIGLEDTFTKAIGSHEFLRQEHGLSAEAITETIFSEALKNTFSRVNGDKLAQHFVAPATAGSTKCLRSASPKNSRKDIFQSFLTFTESHHMESRKQSEIEHYNQEARKWQSRKPEKWKTDVHGVRHDLFLSYRFCHDWIKAHAKGKRFLDYGCGTGIHSIFPAQCGAHVTGIDLSEESLKIARERAQRAGLENQLEFVSMDCEALTFPDHSFDLIFDGGVFSSIDLDKALPKLTRVLKPDGVLLGIETFGHNPLTNLKRKWNQWRGSRTAWAASHIMTMERLAKLREAFHQVEVHYFHLFSLLVLPFVKIPGGAWLFKALDRLDTWLLRFAFFQKYAFKIVFVASQPKEAWISMLSQCACGYPRASSPPTPKAFAGVASEEGANAHEKTWKSLLNIIMKRLFDLIIALTGLLLLSPLLIVIAAWIRLDSPGPIFYRGVRVGKNGRALRIFKFRTMVINADKIGGPSSADDDLRITRIGKSLRKYKLDELPQLINVLKGEMSLVGPRPEVPSEVATYSEEEKKILSVLPGITDFASLKFHNEGEILKGSADPHATYREKIRPEKLRLALQYVYDHSFITDLKIMFETLKTLIKSRAREPWKGTFSRGSGDPSRGNLGTDACSSAFGRLRSASPKALENVPFHGSLHNTTSRSAIAATGKQFRTRNMSKRVQKIVISPIKEMSILADQIQDEDPEAKIISFGQGIPYFDTPSSIKEGIRLALNDPATAKYTLEPGITELRHAVARHLEQEKSIPNINAKKEIMISTGCQEALACALAATLDDGDEVLLPSPCFASHTEQVIQFGGIPIMVPGIESEGWKLNIEVFKKAITPRSKVILFSNPCNPTGAVLTEPEIHELARIATTHDLIVITDETYDFLTYDGVKHFSSASLRELRDRVILCGSFSKKYAMTGYRVGYAFADEGILDHLLKVHDALTICSPAISQKAALAAIEGSQDCVQEHIEKFRENRQLMMQELDRMSEFFSYQKPMGAYYILAKVLAPGPVLSFPLALRILNEAHVITIPGAAFGEGGEGHLRFSFAGNPAQIQEGFARLRGWFSEWKKENFSLAEQGFPCFRSVHAGTPERAAHQRRCGVCGRREREGCECTRENMEIPILEKKDFSAASF